VTTAPRDHEDEQAENRRNLIALDRARLPIGVNPSCIQKALIRCRVRTPEDYEQRAPEHAQGVAHASRLGWRGPMVSERAQRIRKFAVGAYDECCHKSCIVSCEVTVAHKTRRGPLGCACGGLELATAMDDPYRINPDGR